MPTSQPLSASLSKPFNNIALSLSGGGFRAAAYSLGIMSYLHKLKLAGESKTVSLLENVTFISSASGGTITAALYSMFLYQGKKFKDCYQFLLEKLKGEDLLNLVLEKLNDDSQWDPPGIGKTRNLINAFAKVYDEKLFDGGTFAIFWDHQHVSDLSVCFNTTEFYRGLSFRFQTDGNSKTSEYTGNRFVRFDKNNPVYKSIKLADILAASSCFPAGFEPINFPGDFAYPTSQKDTTLKLEDLKDAIILEEYDGTIKPLQNTVGFMDGGITDNQGLQSAMLADDRNRNRGKAFDLIIIGDVTSHFMKPLKPPAEKQPEGWRNLTINGILSKLSGIGKKINSFLTLSVIVMVSSIVAILLDHFVFHTSWVRYIGYILLGISLVTTFLLWLAWRLINRHHFLKKILGGNAVPEIKTILNDLDLGNTFSEDIIAKLMMYLGNTKLNVLEQMLMARLASVLSMTLEANLKHTRRLIYQLFFDNEKWTDRRLYNVCFELSEFNRSNRLFRISKKLWWATVDDKKVLSDVPSVLNSIADDARTMGTTLWFGQQDVKEDKLKKIVCCGQFTTCMNLIEYMLCLERKIERKELTLELAELEKISSVKKQLLEDWAKFKVDPYFFYAL